MVYADFHITGSLGYRPSLDRFVEYGGGGTPTSWVDGRSKLSGGNSASSRYTAAFEAAEADSALLSVEVDTGFDAASSRVTITVSIDVAESVPAFDECVVQIVLVEDGVSSRGNTYDRTVRAILSPQPLTVGEAGSRQTVIENVDLESGWRAANVSAVAWVHRTLPNSASSREVLNAGQSLTLDLTPVREMTWGAIKATWR